MTDRPVGTVVAFGAASWNTMIRVDAFPAPEPGSFFPPSWHETIGSSGAGKAMNLARLGVDVTLRCLIGDDEPGERVRAGLEAAGVTVSAVLDPTGTGRHVNLMDAAGQRISFLLHTGDPAARFAGPDVESLISAADEVLVAITPAARPTLEIARRLGKRTWTDLHSTDGEREYEHDFWTADRVFFSADRLGDPRPFMERLRAAGRELVVCTMAERGALALTADGRWIDVPATPVAPGDLVDSNGAGDAFLAGVVFGELHGLPIERSLAIAARVAAAAVQSADLAPSRIDVDALLTAT
ncbi:MAG TPA: carbohydrate kinase family protein [Candidatus Limnocylindrales bacterium]|nr:carbohydrate kinase family protein [Candidatus Limnocylindrales bacterium]